MQIDGDVYDVSSNRRVYGPGGSYAVMYVFVFLRSTYRPSFPNGVYINGDGMCDEEGEGSIHPSIHPDCDWLAGF